MDETVLPQSTALGTQSDSLMDLDYMDELLLQGCWLETGSEFPYFDVPNPMSPFESSFLWPTPETNPGESGGSPSKDNQEERQKSSFPENLSISPSQGPQNYSRFPSHVQNIGNSTMGSFVLPQNYLLEGSEQSKLWWIGPRASTSVMDRLSQAIGFIRDRSRDKNVLIQVWIPVNRDGKRVLITDDQPVTLDLNCPRLAHYRDISVHYQFPTEEDSNESVGLPGRVFRSKVPEWTPDVRYFTRDEYPRVGHAQQYDVRGTLAVPVLEQGSRSCLGVIEVVMTTQKVKYLPELESVCEALEAVDLTSSEVSNTNKDKPCDLSYQAALPEILEVLKSSCETHGLPLAQTWVSCILQGKGGCRHSEENYKNCVSPVESACYIGDPLIRGFHEACTESHLLKDQGLVGKAFRTNQPCFSNDVTVCSKTEYPLSHYARMFGLKAAVAIRLRSTSTGSADFVLEFFLPVECTDHEEQKKMLNSLSTIIQKVCRTLRVVTDEELQEESSLLNKVENSTDQGSGKEALILDQTQSLRPFSSHVNHQQHTGKSDVVTESSEIRSSQREANSREGITFATNPSTSGDGSSRYPTKTVEKRRTKADKTITLEVLRQHFAGSLKDAARNLGVCPTTLKRICRLHGIQRWPSRKIKKVGHSLQKIQRVIDSVQGTSGVLQIDSFYSNFPELASPNASKTTQFSLSPKHVKFHEGGSMSPPAPASLSPSSSGSQSSSSSQCCSSGKQSKFYSSDVGLEDPSFKEEISEGKLKRARSDANLHLSSNGSNLLPRSQSYISLDEPAKRDNIPLAAESNRKSQERDAPRIKVTFGEDAIRFRMQKTWKYQNLFDEISRRFGINDTSGFHLKYLDDDAEWVLLTCDADLLECIDVCCSSRNNTIRLLFSRDPRSQFGRSFGVITGSL